MQLQRSLIAALVVCVVALPLAAAAQQSAPVPQIGFLGTVARVGYDQTKDRQLEAFREGLQALGYVDGKNIRIDYRIPKTPEELPAMAADLVARKVDVIVTGGPQPIDAARRATDSIPIVIIACDRADRLVATIARPGGNVTGMACISSDLAGKRVQLLQEANSGLKRLSVLYNAAVPAKVEELRDIEAAAKKMEIDVRPVALHGPSDIAAAFAALKAENAPFVALTDPLTMTYVKEIADFATEERLPAIYGFREFCDSGGLLCYGTDLAGLFRRYGYFVDKILKGTKPGDIPVEEPTRFELTVNARTARTFGLAIPPSLLAHADEVIE